MWSTITSSTPFVSQDEYNLFHTIDRKLYSLLVINLWRDPVECMQIMGLWLWLERKGFNNVVKKILSLPYTLTNDLAEEALKCLKCINNDHFCCSPDNADIPLTQNLMGKDISLQYFQENRLNASQGIDKMVKEVCARALSDIMQQAIERNANQTDGDRHTIMSASLPLGFPHNGFGPWMRENEVAPDNRTMFVTFSKGYPVFEGEIREFFTRTYGACIKYVMMQEVRPNEQSLFARIVFESEATIDAILSDMEKAKFTINGKHVWARKYVPKFKAPENPKSSMAPPDLPSGD